MLIELLRSSLQGTAPQRSFFEGAADKDWKSCSSLASRQGVLALAWDGLKRLPEELQPYKGLKISWALAVEDYEKRYKRYCRAIGELSSFYKEHGVVLVQLKGVGLSTYYSIPEHREGGDIDIYTSPTELADSLMEAQGIEVDHSHPKHSHFSYQGIPIENHVTVLDAGRCPLTQKVEDLLHRNLDPQTVKLPTGDKVSIPSDRFNLIFVGYHAISHYGCGLSLHHLYDWACLLKKCGSEIPESIQEPHFMKGIDAMTGLCNELLGTDIPVKASQRVMRDILDDMLHPLDYKYLPQTGAWDIFSYKAKRFRHSIRSQHRFLHTPLWQNRKLWRKVLNSIKWHLNHRIDE